MLGVDVEEEERVVEHNDAQEQDEAPLLFQGPFVPRMVEPAQDTYGARWAPLPNLAPTDVHGMEVWATKPRERPCAPRTPRYLPH